MNVTSTIQKLSLICILFSSASWATIEKSNEIQQQAKAGDAKSQYILSNMYAHGTDVKQDFKQAFQWVKKSAEQGYAAAEFNLASMYDVGEGVDKNLKKAAFWYNKVAEKGEAAAAYNLALMYEAGEGLEQDSIKAFSWLEAAVLMGFEEAKAARDQLSTKLNPEQLKAAEKQAANLINRLHSQQRTTEKEE